MTDTLTTWEKAPVAGLFLAQGMYVLRWYVGVQWPASVVGALPWLQLIGGIAAILAIDGAMIATVGGMRSGRRSRWSVGAIVTTAGFGAAVALHLYGAIDNAVGAWLHAGFALTIMCYLLHLAQPRHRDAPPAQVAAPPAPHVTIGAPPDAPRLTADAATLDDDARMARAVEDVTQDGVSIRKAARTWRVSESTLRRKVK